MLGCTALVAVVDDAILFVLSGFHKQKETRRAARKFCMVETVRQKM